MKRVHLVPEKQAVFFAVTPAVAAICIETGAFGVTGAAESPVEVVRQLTYQHGRFQERVVPDILPDVA